jgi:hypothetical protein
LECVKWLNELELLPKPIENKLASKQLELSEFATALRNGELLCDLANKLCEGCIDPSLISKRAQMSQVLCLKNIRLFLDVCKSEQYFNLSETDLFAEHILYDLLDLASVIRTLSIVSKSRPCQAKGIPGFTFSAAATTIATMPASNSNDSTKQSTTKSKQANLDYTESSSSLSKDLKKKLNLEKNLNSSNEASDEDNDTTSSNGHAAADDIYYNITPDDQVESNYMDANFIIGIEPRNLNFLTYIRHLVRLDFYSAISICFSLLYLGNFRFSKPYS